MRLLSGRRYWWFLTTSVLAGVYAHSEETNEEEEISLVEEILSVTLPKPLSDFTATRASDDDSILYLAGGCDSINGNEFEPVGKFFFCASISASLYRFDASTSTFSTVAPLPRPRYRHAAVMIDNHLWLVGGRDVDDNLIRAVDIYNTITNTWISLDGESVWPEDYEPTSDMASFRLNSFAYIVGGYDLNYTALDTVYAIDTVETLNNQSSLVLLPQPSLTVPRGDISAVTDHDTTFAMVTGGFHHLNDFCEPLTDVELLDLPHTHTNDTEHKHSDTDGGTTTHSHSTSNNARSSDQTTGVTGSWRIVASLGTGRADKALVEHNGHIYAMGGESQVETLCEMQAEPAPGEQTIAVDDVEVYTSSTDTWKTVASMANHRFRFAAVSVENDSTGGAIYTFGGQLSYQEVCQCFPTTNQIVIFRESVSPSSAAASFAFTTWGSLMLQWAVVAVSVLGVVVLPS